MARVRGEDQGGKVTGKVPRKRPTYLPRNHDDDEAGFDLGERTHAPFGKVR